GTCAHRQTARRSRPRRETDGRNGTIARTIQARRAGAERSERQPVGGIPLDARRVAGCPVCAGASYPCAGVGEATAKGLGRLAAMNVTLENMPAGLSTILT